MVEEDDQSTKRLGLNVRIDISKHVLLEKMRKTGFGLARTKRNRSDVYNEVLGYGLQTWQLRSVIGDKEFEHLWRIINRMDMSKLNLEAIEKLLDKANE